MKIKKQEFDREQLYKILTKFIYNADYSSAVKYLKEQKKKFPKNFYIETNLATLPYENALFEKMRGIPEQNRMRTRNEYYWFSQQYLKQYKLGVEGVEAGSLRSYYSQGVGAANYAYKLGLSGKVKLAVRWAKIAESAWEKYFLNVNKKYFDPWTWYALSLGIQGKIIPMEKSLKKAAALAKISYKKDPNLNQIRKMVAEVQRVNL